jgi:predicted transcriptional regulator
MIVEKIMGKYKETARYNVISIRVSDDELKQFQSMAAQYTLSISEMMRQAIEHFTASRFDNIVPR